MMKSVVTGQAPVGPFRAPEPLPILKPSNFVTQKGFPAVNGVESVSGLYGFYGFFEHTFGGIVRGQGTDIPVQQ